MSAHALLPPSAAEQWFSCPGSLALCKDGKPKEDTLYSAEGTFAHDIAARALETGKVVSEFVGTKGKVGQYDFTFTEEDAGYVGKYVNRVRDAKGDGYLLTERRVHFAPLVGLPQAVGYGTSDAVIFRDNEIQVHDLKYGRGVRVSAHENKQLMIYAAGVMYEYGSLLGDINRIRLFIHQPRINNFSEWDFDHARFVEFVIELDNAMHAALEQAMLWDSRTEKTFEGLTLNPGEKQCRFCPAKAVCPAKAQQVLSAVMADFDVVT